MKIASIDFSLISPALTYYNSQTHTYSFISFTSVPSYHAYETSKKYETHRDLQPYIEVIPYIREINKSTYQTTEETKVLDAMSLSNLIIHKINSFHPDIVSIEGYSFASHSASYIDLVSYQSILREKIKKYGYPLYVIAPTEGKKCLSGKGNADKMTQIRSFIDNRADIPYIENNPFFLFLQSYQINEKYPKPIDDIVDSLGILLGTLKLIQ